MLSRDAVKPLPFNTIVGNSETMLQLHELIERVAPTNAPVMIIGETGTGKELVARAIHCLSRRRDKPFMAINGPAMDDSLWRSEIFGHEKGAFTGAMAQKKGRFELADNGTFF